MKTLNVYWLAWIAIDEELMACNINGSAAFIPDNWAIEFSKEDLLARMSEWLRVEVSDSMSKSWRIECLEVEVPHA